MKRLHIHREGRNIIIGLVLVLFIINIPIYLFFPHWIFAITLILTAMLLVFVTYFFRNPVRVLEETMGIFAVLLDRKSVV